MKKIVVGLSAGAIFLVACLAFWQIYSPTIVQVMKLDAELNELLAAAENASDEEKIILDTKSLEMLSSDSGVTLEFTYNGERYEAVKVKNMRGASTLLNLKNFYMYSNKRSTEVLPNTTISAMCFESSEDIFCTAVFKKTSN